MSDNGSWFEESADQQQVESREQKRQLRKDKESEAFAVFGQIVAWGIGIGLFVLTLAAMFRALLWLLTGI